MARQSRSQPVASSLRLLGSFIRPYMLIAVLTVCFMALCIAGMLYIPTELANLMNAALDQGSPEILLARVGAMGLAAVTGSGSALVTNYFAARLAAHVGRDLRVAIYQASLAFSGSDFERIGTGSMITRTLSDVTVVQQTLLMSIVMILPVPFTCTISIALAFSIDAWMGWILLAVTFAVLAISLIALRASAPIFMRLQGFIDRMNARLREAITGVRVIRAFGKEDDARARLDTTFSEYATGAIKVNMLFAAADSLTFFLMNSVEALIIWVGADRVGAHAMQIGSISALIQYALFIMFFMMMAQIALLSVPRALACLQRAQEVLTLVPEIQDPAEPAALPAFLAPSAPIAAFVHAGFRFADADEDTLHDLNLELRRNETTAIIGNTGSGKSTIAKMLLRFHDVTTGQLLFQGIDVRDLALVELRAKIAYVSQRAWLFSGTIAENLRRADPHADDARLWWALDAAQAGFVRDLPDGLASHVSPGGTNFSGGQRQRLAIARALVRKADLYIFDDSFSALDARTDAALRHALAAALSDAAVLVIAQRISTVRDADQIAAFKDGRIVGLGRHEELLESCSVYREIAESQNRGGESGGETSV
ncbi:ABC transporter ATP-binding protein/permease [Collinsella sp. AGMB00827]|uniref:ABC transporter ATP-binding protein/permease n=1 Tax=Collinsella ureilytica TaxID=2869515 RepID=A0ABS7MKN5_9ACTN|nr:ABC transporter ATP-binding protein [Collinsella urealyticum]MBY4797650.1 ABC transporter ATP-binding protein/permease [Collinsella urealyticum]